MNQIVDLNLLKGKIIKQVFSDLMDQHLVFVFEDNTYFHVYSSRGYDGECEISYESDVDDDLKVDCGIITQEEYKKILEDRLEANAKYVEQREYELYLKLHEKFGK